MADALEIVYDDRPQDGAWGTIGKGVHDHNVGQAGDSNAQRLCYVLRTPDEEVVGGVIAEIHWDWLSIDLLWVREDLRGQGHGTGLLAAVEREAKQRGARQAHLDTFSFQAADFYLHRGYRPFGELRDYPQGHQRFYLAKRL